MIYIMPLGSIFKTCDILFHLYVDDTQLYLSFKPGDQSALTKLGVCFQELKIWLLNNFLTLNKAKTEVILFGPSDSSLDLGDLAKWVSSCMKNLGVYFTLV